jgi:hypothetical protein
MGRMNINFRRNMKIILLLVLPISFEMASVSRAEILSSDRVVRWQGNVGVSGGIPVYPCGVTLPANSTAAIINSNLASIASNRAVCLQAGSGTWSGVVNIPSDKVLRGSKDASGSPTTLISSSASYPTVEMGGSWAEPAVCVALSADAPKGSTTVQSATKPSCLAPGALLYINAVDDPAIVNSTGSEGMGTHLTSADNNRSLGHFVKVTSITGTNNPYTVNIELPLAYTFRVANAAQLKTVGSNWKSYNGIEDVQITLTASENTPGLSGVISMIFTSNSWVKNVKTIHSTGNAAVWMYSTYRDEVRDSWFYDGTNFTAGVGYGISMFYYTTANLIENNIIRYFHAGTPVNYGGAYNVFGYNYILEGNAPPTGGSTPGPSTHGAHAYMNLWEGNYSTNRALFDFTHGSGSHQTLFRNRIEGLDDYNTQNAVAIDYYNRYVNVVGNVLGKTGVHTAYKAACAPGIDGSGGPYVFALGYVWNYPVAGHDGCDPTVSTTDATHTLIHGNYAYCTSGTGCNTVSWDAAIADRSIPNSYYLSSKPSFFGGLPWPAIGPDLNPMVGSIPAKHRYEGIPIPPASQVNPPSNVRIP